MAGVTINVSAEDLNRLLFGHIDNAEEREEARIRFSGSVMQQFAKTYLKPFYNNKMFAEIQMQMAKEAAKAIKDMVTIHNPGTTHEYATLTSTTVNAIWENVRTQVTTKVEYLISQQVNRAVAEAKDKMEAAILAEVEAKFTALAAGDFSSSEDAVTKLLGKTTRSIVREHLAKTPLSELLKE